MNTYANPCIWFCTISIVFGLVNSIESSTEENTTQDTTNIEENKLITDTDIIQLNVGGELVMTIRSTLTRINNSVLAFMFSGRWEKQLSRDKQGNVFLDFNPILFHHLLDQLRLIEHNESVVFHPPLLSSFAGSFEKMLKRLEINQFKKLDDVIEMNVGGEVLTTSQKILTQVSNSTTDLFVDSNPQVFRQLIDQLREKKEIELVSTTPSEQNLHLLTPMTDQPDGICADATWNSQGITVAGGNGKGSELNQLDHPMGLFIDENASIYVADTYNHRIMKWKSGASRGEIVVDANSQNNSTNYVSSIVVYKNKTIYLCNRFHNRVERWLENADAGETILSNTCWGLALDRQGSLYISGHEDHRIIKWPSIETVAGGHGEGNADDQLSSPFHIFIDNKQSIYIADYFNHRIMKWFSGLHEGIVVAGGNGFGAGVDQLKLPHSVRVDQMGTMYIIDFGNERVMRWFEHSKKGIILIGNNGSGSDADQLADPYDLAFDREGNLYVADTSNHRIQMFRIDKSACISALNSTDAEDLIQ